MEWLGLFWNLSTNALSIPDRKIVNTLDVLHFSRRAMPVLPVRVLARCTGKIMSMMPVLGNICKLMIKSLHRAIEARSSWDATVDLRFTEGSAEEIFFWDARFEKPLVRDFFVPVPFELVNIYSDASSVVVERT